MTTNNCLAQEQAIAVELNGITFAVMMMTPQNLQYFAIGFLFTEGIIQRDIDVHNIEEIRAEKPNSETNSSISLGITLKISLANRSFYRFKERIRLLKGSSGCGICGSAALVQTFDNGSPNKLQQQAFQFDIDLLKGIRKKVQKYQTISANSGAMHGAFLICPKGAIKASCEDIGRHNALDKLIGNILVNKLNYQDHAALVTSRCGAELVQKTIRLGIKTLISFASPSNLALQLANQANVTLIHVPKKDAPFVYSPPANNIVKASVNTINKEPNRG